MRIETKYDPETTAWVMHENKPLNCFIERVETASPHSGEKGTLIIYYMRYIPHYFYEDDVYETKFKLFSEGQNTLAFWANGKNDPYGNRFVFTELRQTIVLFMAAIAGEL